MSKLGRIVPDIAQEILKKNYFAKDAAGQLYHYKNGVYRPHGMEHVAKATKTIAKKIGSWEDSLPQFVHNYIAIDAPSLLATPDSNIVNVSNGLLNVLTGILGPHSPKYRCGIQIPVKYDPAATCAVWEKFCERSLPKDYQSAPYQFAGYGMQTDRSLQQAGLFMGPGEDGKSVLLNALSGFVGLRNVANLNLHRIEGDRFACARLVGKLLNICADLPSKILTESSMFKCIVGQDRIIGENKFERLFEFTPHVFLVFSANHYPRILDAGFANYRRYHVVPFERKFTDAEKIPNESLLRMLTAPTQLSGVLNKAIALLPNIRQHGFSTPQSSKDAMDEFVALTDPMAQWLNQNTELAPPSYVPTSSLLTRYNEHLRREQRPEKTQNGFTRDLKRLRPNVELKQRTVAGKVVWCYVGLRLKLTSNHRINDFSPR